MEITKQQQSLTTSAGQYILGEHPTKAGKEPCTSQLPLLQGGKPQAHPLQDVFICKASSCFRLPGPCRRGHRLVDEKMATPLMSLPLFLHESAGGEQVYSQGEPSPWKQGLPTQVWASLPNTSLCTAWLGCKSLASRSWDRDTPKDAFSWCTPGTLPALKLSHREEKKRLLGSRTTFGFTQAL